MAALLSPSSTKSRSPKRDDKVLSGYSKYTYLSFQMMAIIGSGVWLGMKLDEYFQVVFPIFMSILALTSTAYAVYVVIKGLSHQQPPRNT